MMLGLIGLDRYLNELIVNFFFSFPLAYCAFASFFLDVFAMEKLFKERWNGVGLLKCDELHVVVRNILF